jgi:hypothetical protein
MAMGEQLGPPITDDELSHIIRRAIKGEPWAWDVRRLVDERMRLLTELAALKDLCKRAVAAYNGNDDIYGVVECMRRIA